MTEEFCEYCDSKGVRHLKTCTRPQETKEDKTEEVLKQDKKTSFDVYSPSGYVRTYSVEDHGENAEEIAKGFAAKYANYIVK